MVVQFARPVIRPLEQGERLDQTEFERRCNAMPSNIRAELINGVVFMASPVRANQHGDPHSDLHACFVHYRTYTPGVRSPIDATIRFDDQNQPQPDLILMIEAAKGGQAAIDGFGYIASAPELVAEIAASTADNDLNEKLEVYRRFGVREYIVWRVLDKVIDWFILRNGRFEPLAVDAEGIRKSQVFPGLWLDSTALLRGDLATAITVIQRGLSSPEHVEFARKLGK